MSELMAGGYMGRAYDIDLSSGEVRDLAISDEDRARYLGGKGLGTRLLYDHTEAGLDPYDERMALIFATGPVTGTAAPQSNRFVVVTKSPLTGAIASSTCGGDFATKLKKAGVDLVMIRGRAERPVYLEISEQGVAIHDAAHLWGKPTGETQRLLPKGLGKAVIGPAGENRVRFACIVSQDRVAGRAGCGAVMGAKNLKAIVAGGTRQVPIADKQEHSALRKWLTRYLLSHPMTGTVLPRLGTAHIVAATAGRNILPVRNFQQGTDPRALRISGEELAERYLKRKVGCASCPIRCGRGIEREGRRVKGPEYESLGLLGANLGNFDLERVNQYNELCDELGLDTISTGGVLGFATELTERGMLDSPLRFDDHDAVAGLIEDIAHRRGLGDELADGVRRLSERYGGADFAMQVKGLELPAYDPRGCYGQGLEYATTSRGGCHVQGSTMYLEALGPVSVDPLSTRAKPELVILQQNLAAAIGSSVFCIFSTYAMIPPAAFKLAPNGLGHRLLGGVLLRSGPLLGLVLKGRAPLQLLWFEKFLSHVTGRRMTMGDFVRAGERIFNLERLYNLREGLTAADDTLPRRLREEPTFPEQTRGVPLHEMLPAYYRRRGWDSQGVPTPKTLARLGLAAS